MWLDTAGCNEATFPEALCILGTLASMRAQLLLPLHGPDAENYSGHGNAVHLKVTLALQGSDLTSQEGIVWDHLEVLDPWLCCCSLPEPVDD